MLGLVGLVGCGAPKRQVEARVRPETTWKYCDNMLFATAPDQDSTFINYVEQFSCKRSKTDTSQMDVLVVYEDCKEHSRDTTNHVPFHTMYDFDQDGTVDSSDAGNVPEEIKKKFVGQQDYQVKTQFRYDFFCDNIPWYSDTISQQILDGAVQQFITDGKIPEKETTMTVHVNYPVIRLY